MSRSAALSTGTGTREPVCGSTIAPWSVPNAIVVTGTPAFLAAAAATSFGRPRRVAPSDISTIAAGAGVWAGGGWWVSLVIPAAGVEDHSPMGVASASFRVVDDGRTLFPSVHWGHA